MHPHGWFLSENLWKEEKLELIKIWTKVHRIYGWSLPSGKKGQIPKEDKKQVDKNTKWSATHKYETTHFEIKIQISNYLRPTWKYGDQNTARNDSKCNALHKWNTLVCEMCGEKNGILGLQHFFILFNISLNLIEQILQPKKIFAQLSWRSNRKDLLKTINCCIFTK